MAWNTIQDIVNQTIQQSRNNNTVFDIPNNCKNRFDFNNIHNQLFNHSCLHDVFNQVYFKATNEDIEQAMVSTIRQHRT